MLAQPVGTTLYFAGEATHNTAPSTVPGALQSGERAGGEADVALHGPPSVNAPTADFTALPVTGVEPVLFTDTSSQSPTSWSWNFGDTGTSTVQHPTHQYTALGTYTVSLTATNVNGSDTKTRPLLIEVPEPSATLQLFAGIFGLTFLNARRRGGSPRGPA